MKQYLSLVFLFFISISLFSMPQYSLEKVRGGYRLIVDIPTADFQEITVHDNLRDGTPVNETFLRVSVPGFASSVENIGGPELVQSSFKLAIEDAVPEYVITKIIEKEKILPQSLYPVQQVYPYCLQDEKRSFSFNRQFYTSENIQSSYITISDPFFIRGQKGVSVTVSPIKYNPRINKLSILKSITVLFKTEELSCVKSQGSRHYDKYLRKVFRNLHDDCGRSVPSEPFREREKYVILAADTYKDNADLNRFVEFRERDYDVVVSSVADIGGNHPTTINTFLQQEQPTYALFVGMYQDFYYYQGTEPMNNKWTYTYVYYQSYGEMDPHPDFHLGLFFVRSAQSLTNAVNKTIHTASHLDEMGNGYVAFTGHNMTSSIIEKDHIEKLFGKFENDYWQHMDITLTKVYQVLEPIGDASVVVEKMNEGVRFINYNGHGWEYGWPFRQEPSVINWTSKYGLENWGEITNSIYPFVISCACHTGDFMHEGDGGESWAETWLGHERLGTAFIGSQEASSFNQHALNRGILIRLLENDMTRLGDMMDFGKEYTFDSLGTHFGKLGAQEYHLFGDPASETIYDGTTSIQSNTNNVSHTISLVTVTPGYVTLSIPEKDIYTISLFQANGRQIIKYKTHLSPGRHTIPLDRNNFSRNVYFLSIKGSAASFIKKLLL